MAMEIESSNTMESQPLRKGIFSRFRLGRKNKGAPTEFVAATQESAIPHKSTVISDATRNSENLNDTATEEAHMKTVRFPANDALKKVSNNSRRQLEKPPTAREAAFGGPPRYDWIDIVRMLLLFVCAEIGKLSSSSS